MWKKTVFVYRVENAEGRGCYSTPETKWLLWNHDADFIRHPVPQRDYGIYRAKEKGEVCAFKSLAQLFDWFTPYQLFELWKMGFKVRRISATITAEGERQVLIRKFKKGEENVPRQFNSFLRDSWERLEAETLQKV